MRHVDLDPVSAVVELLARSFARFNRTVNQLRAFGNGNVRVVAFERISAGRRNRASDAEDARSGNDAFIHGALDAHVAVSRAFSLEIADGGKTLFECAASRDGRAGGTIRDLKLQELVIVSAFGRIFAL